MRAFPYSDLLAKVEARWLGSHGEFSADDESTARVFINTWAQQLWEESWWPEWKLTEQRTFRPAWAVATSYGASTATVPVEVYHVRTGKYAQSLVSANIGNIPFTDSGVENSAYWAESQASYSGNDFAAAIAYSVGMIVRNPEDNRYYQCHTAHTSGATLDATKFGILTAFRRSIDYEQTGETPIGTVRAVWDRDPQVYFGEACDLEFNLADKIYVTGGAGAGGGDPGTVWVEFLTRPPTWTGDAWAAATTYAVDDQVYDSGEGDFFKSLQGTNSNHAVTDTAYWERVTFPWVLRDAVAQGVYSEMLRGSGDLEAAALEEARANGYARDAFVLLNRRQRQSRRLPMKI
jgi:hypothetical protein